MSKYARAAIFVLIVIAVIVIAGLKVSISGKQSVESQPKETNESGETNTEPADNYYCYVCHINFQGEELTETHRLAGVGCEDCHGRSAKHSSDEDGLTPPEIIYPKDKINSFCMSCHAEKNIGDIPAHGPLFAEDGPDKKYCTYCHGKHLMKVRTRRWDKDTGELIWDDGVRMMKNPNE